MHIHPPCIITARLLPGIKVGNGTISIRYAGWSPDNRRIYRFYIDAPGCMYKDTTLRSGVGGGSLQSGLASVLGFLSHAAESAHYLEQHPGTDDVDKPMFPPRVIDWAREHQDEIDGLSVELEDPLADLIRE